MSGFILKLEITQRVHIYYQYGIRPPKTIPSRVLGLNSITVVYMDPLGYESFNFRFFRLL